MTLGLAYVVPTKDRPEDLAKLLQSLAAQTVAPDQIVIVDGSDDPIDGVIARFPDLPVTYVRVRPPSLSAQRNAGMAKLADGINVAGYLDDDIVLEPDATERMAAFWRNAGEDIGGAAFNILNQPRAGGGLLTSFFLLNGKVPGRLRPSGWPSQIPTLEETIETSWLNGGATMWRREVIDAFQYDEWFIGHGYGEDVDFSYRVGRRYRLFVLADARVYHYTRPIRLASQYDLGRQQVVNRLYFIYKARDFPAIAVVWGMFGQIIANLLNSLFTLNSAGVRRFAGNVAGLASLLRGGGDKIGGYYK